MCCAQCSKLQKKMRVLQSDFEFQFRKLSQDKSTEKAMFEINTQKQLRKWQQKYAKERSDHEQNSKKWLHKIDSVTSDCQSRLKQTQLQWQQLFTSSKHHSQKQLSEFKLSIQLTHHAALNEIISKYQLQATRKDQHYHRNIEAIMHEHSVYIQHMRRDSAQKESKLRDQYQSTILGLTSQRFVDQKNILKMHEEFRVQKCKLVSQLYQLKYQISRFELNIQDLNKAIQQKEDRIIAKEGQMTSLASSYEQQISELKSKYERQLCSQQARNQQRIKQFFENELMTTERYELSIAKIQQNRQIELELYRNNMNQIKNCVESRISRIEDVQQILHLKGRLSKKEKECEVLERQLKDYQLQLENKEDTYNKIFIPTINSTHLPGENIIKRKQLKMKRAGRSITTVRQILSSVNVNSSNLPLLNNMDRKLLPPRATKVL